MEGTMVVNSVALPRMLQQDGTTTDNDCLTSGDYISCPAQADFTFGGEVKQIQATLSCPLDATAQSDFRTASQEGLCECDASLVALNASDAAAVPLDCECFICPDQANQFGVAFTCTTPITGPCTVFNCAGICNGDLNFISSATNAPTPTPVEDGADGGGGSAAMIGNPNFATAALLVFTLVRMFR